MTIQNITQAEEILKSYVPNANKYYSDGLSLDRMWPMLELAGNPHQKLKVVHVAGTSGKTSTAYYIAALLTASGKKTGLTVSPHVDSITERLQFDGQNISEAQFCVDLGEFLELIKEVDNPSYFELLMVFVLWEFVRSGVDYAVLETGLGGLLDSTNVVTREDKVCVITDIGLDHMQILGNTIEEIAQQKAGIIHDGNHVLMHHQPENVMDVISNQASRVGASVEMVDDGIADGKLPLYQVRNYSLAVQVVDYLAKRDSFEAVKTVDAQQIFIPGRMEEFSLVNDGTLVMDGAHNQQKMHAFVTSYQHKYPDIKATVLLALKVGKEYEEVLSELQPIVDSIIITTFSGSQDLPTTAQDPELIAKHARSLGIKTTVEPDQKEALAKLLTSSQQHKIITGSFYLIGQMRKLLLL